MIPEEESSKEPAEKSGAQEEEDHDAPLNARASMDMKWSVPGSAMSRAGHGRQRRLR